MGYVRDTLLSQVYPNVSDEFFKGANWQEERILLPRIDAVTKQWLWTGTHLKGVSGRIKADGNMGMVHITETRWVSEKSFVLLRLQGKIDD